jgi:rubrerythrin
MGVKGTKTGGPVEITASYPAGKTGSTAQNLLLAAEGEKEEWGTLYPEFAAVAKQENFKAIAASFTEISEVEQEHERRYRKLLAKVEKKQVFKREQTVKWHCRNCGYIHEGPEAPKTCPACKHPQAYYELWCEMY